VPEAQNRPAARSVRAAAAHLALMMAGLLSGPLDADAAELGLPADCTVGRDCFVQQFPDMDPGPDALDPFCGSATYDGHDGTDLRILSMADVERGVKVLAMADGKVLRLRDGEPDRLVLSDGDRKAVASKECGNGLLIDHGDGLETQYCHLKLGSISVEAGSLVKQGDPIGEIGASGLAQFPHVHVTVRKNGQKIDPSTGAAIGAGCKPDPTSPAALFAPTDVQLLGHGDTQILALGLAGGAIDYPSLVVSGPPPPATAASPALVGWVWLMNLRKHDRLTLTVTAPSGEVLSTQTTDPMDRPKASYSAFTGKRGAPSPGTYVLMVAVIRDGKEVLTRTEQLAVQ
jgi:murein DD-endopeptidase MepM/ murein hydrolase activator NlpD